MRLLTLFSTALFCLAGCGGRQAGEDWPQRPLMEARFEDSIQHRYLSKEIQDSRSIDDMEDERGWSSRGIVQMSYTSNRARDGRRALRFRTSMRDEAHIKSNIKDGSFAGGQGGHTRIALPFDPPQDWSAYNRLSLWVYVHPTSMQAYSFSLQFECEGAPAGPQAPVPVHHVHDLEHGEWNHVVWEIPNFQRDKVTSFSIGQILRGHEPEDEGVVTYDFDQLEIQRVDAEAYEGWEVAPGKIAFSHVGYHPSGEKLAFATGIEAGRFELVDAATKEVVAAYPVKETRNARGSFQTLDFTEFTKQGRYFLRCGGVTGRPFSISEDVWHGTIEKVLNAYYGLRCGFPVPGVHRVCHEDLRGVHEGEEKFINGGWHDAGDLSQGSHRTGVSVYSMLRIYDELRQRGLKPELQERVLEEAKWGLDWLLKTRFGQGYRITWALLRIYTDNKIGTIDDVIVPARHIAYENFLFAMAGAYAGRVLEEADPLRAAASLAAAVEDFQATLDQRRDWSRATRIEAAFGALAAVELFRVTGEPRYADEAARFGKILLDCQERRFAGGIPITGYFYEDTARERIVHDFHGSFKGAVAAALAALCETYPEHEDWMNWYAGVLLHSEYFLRRGSRYSEPYNRLPNSVWRRDEIEAMPETAEGRGWSRQAALPQYEESTRLAEGYRLRTFPIWPDSSMHGSTAIHLASTAALHAAARLRNDLELANLAERQLQWVVGVNPFSQSLMYGEGYDFQPHFAYCLRNLTGALPVGMDALHNDSPYWPANNKATYKEIWVVPMSRFLGNMASSAMPARVSGAASSGAVFRERRTGVETAIPAGEFARNLAPGRYEITFGNAAKRMPLLPGGRYELSLDPSRFIAIELHARDAGQDAVTIEAEIRGAGDHTLELRAFNGTVKEPSKTITLAAGQPRRVTWRLAVRRPDTPWAAAVIPDGDLGGKAEITGAPAP